MLDSALNCTVCRLDQIANDPAKSKGNEYIDQHEMDKERNVRFHKLRDHINELRLRDNINRKSDVQIQVVWIPA